LKAKKKKKGKKKAHKEESKVEVEERKINWEEITAKNLREQQLKAPSEEEEKRDLELRQKLGKY